MTDDRRDPAPQNADPGAGSLIVGPYRLTRRVSAGAGATEVWEGIGAGGERVAVKRLLAGTTLDHVHRFTQEAMLLERLGGQHGVVGLIERVALPPATVLRWAEGGSLRDRIHPAGFSAPSEPQPVDAVLRLAGDLLEALAWLHRNQVIHRDVKPGNVLLDAGGRALLADLSVAASGDPARSLPDGWIEEDAGTLGYAAPELLRDPGAASPAVDVYGLGVTLYETMTGAMPHDMGPRESERDLRWRLARGEPPVPLARRGWRGPGDLGAAVLRALEPDPARRYGSIAELRADLIG